jgi:N-methylhydantoinase A
MICQELEIPFFLVPRESSIFCAAGMLLSDLKHDFVRSLVARMDRLEVKLLGDTVNEMIEEGRRTLTLEHIPQDRMRFELVLDMRYVKQYHEVSCPAPVQAVVEGHFAALTEAFHKEHNRLYGYSLENEGTPVELINVRLSAIGVTDKPRFEEEAPTGPDASAAIKSNRSIFIPERDTFQEVPVYDGHVLKHGNRIEGPALIEQVNTTVLVTSTFDTFCDAMGSFVVHAKGFDVAERRMK